MHEHLWVKLLSDHGGKKAGTVVRLASTEEKERLLAAGSAEDCANPEALALEETVAELAASVADAAVQAVDKRLETLARAQPAGPRPIPAEPHDERVEKLNGFRGTGEFWAAVVRAGTPGQVVDARLVRKAPSGLNTLEGADGGFLVPETISNQITELVYDEANLLARTDTQTITGNSIVLKAVDESSRVTGARRGGVRGYWLSEAEQYVASKPRFRELTLKPHKLGVFYYATDEELADSSGFALEQKLAQYAAEEINWLVSEAIIAGDGVGKPLGILNSTCLVTVGKEAGQTADTINYKNIVKMYARMLPRSVNRAVWLVNVDTLPQLMSLAFPDASGTVPAFLNGNAFPSASASPYGSLLGRPILVTEHNPTLGDAGDILFVDPAMYKTVTRGGVRAAMSIHVRFDYGETAFRFDFRIDGQPWLDAPVTPAKGTATLAPFVALEART